MKPWVKAWRPRQGSRFEARVSAPARMLFRGLLAYLDDDGSLELPKAPHAHAALGLAVGYTSNERRALKGQLAELVKHGCVSIAQDDDGFWSLTMPEWERFQGRGEVAKSRPSHHRSTSTPHPPHHKSTPTSSQVDIHSAPTPHPPHHTAGPNPPKSLQPDLQEKREKEKREGEEREEVTPLSGGCKPPTPPLLVVVPSKPKRRRPKEPISRAAWAAYSAAFERRYSVTPKRNASQSSKMAAFVKRVGADEAPHIAAFFVEHNASWYVSKMHPVGALLNDAEKLHAEWSTGRKVTRGDAREAERADELRAQSERVRQRMERAGIEDR